MTVERIRVRVSGKVQGVWFRAWTVERARELGVRGWVRNLADGSVEVEVEGAAAAVARLVELVRRGPPLAEVAGVEELAASTEPLPDPFEIRYSGWGPGWRDASRG